MCGSWLVTGRLALSPNLSCLMDRMIEDFVLVIQLGHGDLKQSLGARKLLLQIALLLVGAALQKRAAAGS